MKSKPIKTEKRQNPDLRKNWAEAFKIMAKNGDDALMDADLLSEQSSWDKEEWRFEGLDDEPTENTAYAKD